MYKYINRVFLRDLHIYDISYVNKEKVNTVFLYSSQG